MYIEERRAEPRKSTLISKPLRETVEFQLDTNVRELAARMEVHYSMGSCHFAGIGKSKILAQLIPHELAENLGNKRVAARLDLLLRQVETPWTEPLCGMRNGVPTITGSVEPSAMISTLHQNPSLNRVFTR
ncbi:hypothetical protein M514_16069 [Trichuris suis]|uniref:Uncharacterized protein n=1 Tax=Trichuris suis TaxID=68888 RepID=A0A085NQ03_9BILA|nr:hypothetical protein M514_16069 [Trichuris suis]